MAILTYYDDIIRFLKNIRVKKPKAVITITYKKYMSKYSSCNYDNYNNHYMISAITAYIQKHRVSCGTLDLVINHSHQNEYDNMMNSKHMISPSDKFVIVDNVSIKIMQRTTTMNELMTTEYTVILESAKKEFIDALIKAAYQSYVDTNYIDCKPSSNRFLYKIEKFSSAEKTPSVLWDKYPFKTNKSFDAIFIPEKEQIISILDAFEKKTGVYAKPNAPCKLSFMLHGPPGTGKTSLAQAIAKYTNRHIVSIKLGKITTNQLLEKVFFSEKLCYSSVDRTGHNIVKYDVVPLGKRVIILEEIDTANKMVSIRTGPTDQNKQSNLLSLLSLMDKNDDNKDNNDDDKDKDDKAIEKKDKEMNNKDDADIGGVLEVLDGLLPLTDAIIVMTTNHKDRLDPAIYRDGRVTYDIELSYMTKEDIVKMIAYADADTNKYMEKLIAKLDGADIKITPSKLEGLLLKYSVDHVIDLL